MVLHYSDSGSGEITLLFLHYFGGSGRTWQPVIENLEAQYRCITIDMPGFGQSPAPQTEPSIKDNRDEVLAVMNQLQLSKFVLIGHSMGGKIAMAVAATRPPDLMSMILFAPSPPVAEPMTQDQRRELEEAWGHKEKLEKHIRKITARPLPPTYLEQTVADNLNAHASAWLGWLDKGSLENISGEMINIKIPVTVVSGSEDKGLSTLFLKEEFSRYFPGLAFIEINDCGHLLPLEKPDEVAEIIRRCTI